MIAAEPHIKICKEFTDAFARGVAQGSRDNTLVKDVVENERVLQPVIVYMIHKASYLSYVDSATSFFENLHEEIRIDYQNSLH